MSSNQPPLNPSNPWVWDYAVGQYVRYDTHARRWVDTNGQAVARAPQTVPTPPPPVVPSAPVPPATGKPGKQATAASGGKILATPGGAGVGNTASVEHSLAQLDINTSTTKPKIVAAYKTTATDKRTGTETLWDVTETRQYKDPSNTESTRSLNVKRIRQPDTKKVAKSLSGFRVSERPLVDYRPGRVIEVALVPPDPDKTSSTVSRITPSPPDVPIGKGMRLRRFVIVRQNPEGRSSFEALAIKTNYGRGVASPGVIKSHYAIIHTSIPPPVPDEAELPQRNESGHIEGGMQTNPIRVEAFDRTRALDPKARLDYMDTYEFDFGVPNVRLWGRIHDSSEASFYAQYNHVYAMVMGAAAGPGPGGAGGGGGISSSAASTTETVIPTQPTYNPPATTAYGPVAVTGTTSRGPTSGTPGGAATGASGINSESQMYEALQKRQDHAKKYSLTVPTATAAQLRDLAQNAQKRAAFFKAIDKRWRKDQGLPEFSDNE